MSDNGRQLLSKTWFSTIENLAEILMYESDPSARVAAGEVLVKYFIALGQSVNEPYLPEEDIRDDGMELDEDEES